MENISSNKAEKTGRKVIFLLGAGASVEAGIHTSNEITDVFTSYGSYCPSEYSTDIENLLRYLQVRIGDYLQIRASEVNFEFLLGALMELARREQYPIVPLLGAGDDLVRKLEQRISLDKVIDKLYVLLRELLSIRRSLKYLYPLKSFLKPWGPLSIFTLNYDLTLESTFRDLGISFTTGYQREKGKPRLWAPENFEKKKFSGLFFKLHGSLNWGHYFQAPPPPTSGPPYAAAIDTAARYINAFPRRVEFSLESTGVINPPDRAEAMVSLMNFGTRKEILYTSSQFNLLFSHFSKALQNADVCIVAGYSFRDATINKWLEESMAIRQGRLRLLIVDPSAFQITYNSPLLWKLDELGWLVKADKNFGDALDNDWLFKETKKLLGTPVKPPKSPILSTPAPIHGQETVEPNPKMIIEAWERLGLVFDSCHFWAAKVAPDVRKLHTARKKDRLITLGTTLAPLVENVRKLCFAIRKVHEELHCGNTYGGEYLKSIIPNPKQTKKSSPVSLVHQWLPQLVGAVSVTFNTYNDDTDEFIRCVKDPDYGKSIGAPSNWSFAAEVMRKTTQRTYELVEILNDVYRGAGFDQPFEKIAAHRKEQRNGNQKKDSSQKSGKSKTHP